MLAGLAHDTKIKLDLGTLITEAGAEVQIAGPALWMNTAGILDRDGWLCISGHVEGIVRRRSAHWGGGQECGGMK
jgi:hypothetical protein